MSAGGTVSIIVILSSLHDGPQDVFRGNYKNDAGHKSIHSIKLQPPFPREMGMFVDKEFYDKQNNQRGKKTLKESVYVSGIVEKIFLFVLAFFFHMSAPHYWITDA
jgi:hypothetical protein